MRRKPIARRFDKAGVHLQKAGGDVSRSAHRCFCGHSCLLVFMGGVLHLADLQPGRGARGLGDEQGVSEWLRLLVVIHGPSASIHTELGFTPKSQGVAAWAPFSLFLLFL